MTTFKNRIINKNIRNINLQYTFEIFENYTAVNNSYIFYESCVIFNSCFKMNYMICLNVRGYVHINNHGYRSK